MKEGRGFSEEAKRVVKDLNAAADAIHKLLL